MRRENRRASVAPALEQEILHEPDVDRIEPGRRLVEHAQLGVAQQHGGDLHLLGHALAQAIDLPAGDMRQLDALEPFARAPARLGAAEALERAEVGHHVGDGQLRVEPALLRQVAEAVEVLAPPRLAEHAHLARVRPDDVHQDPDERALAGAVRTEQAEDLAGVHFKGDAAKGRSCRRSSSRCCRTRG